MPATFPIICPQLQQTGVCNDSACTRHHDVIFCEPCWRVFIRPEDHKAHLRSRHHKKEVSGRSRDVFCPLCNRKFDAPNWAAHTRGRRHRNRATQQGLSRGVKPQEPPVSEGEKKCELCSKVVLKRQWEGHVRSAEHRRREQFASFRSKFDDASQDKHGVTVSHVSGLDFGVVALPSAQTGVTIDVVLKNTAPTSSTRIVAAELASSHSALRTPSSFLVSSLRPDQSILRCGKDAHVTVTFRQSYSGRAEDRLWITFEDTSRQQSFHVVRLLKAIVGNKAEYDAMKPTTPFVPRKRTKHQVEKEVIPGIPPPPLDIPKWVVKLKQYPIPSSVKSILDTRGIEDIIEQLKRSVLPAELRLASYAEWFRLLLWTEEDRMEHDLQVYDMEDARLTKQERYYFVAVPGLAEKRPSVLTGDRMLVQRQGDAGRWFEGHVHVLHKAEVGLCFHSSFHMPMPGQVHNVRFKLNRIPLRRQHQALNTAFSSEHILFPQNQHIAGLQRITATITPYNGLVFHNPAQMEAVRAITYRPAGSVPFIVFGPPGTGKTVTIVEAIRQVLKVDSKAFILACAPSNSAADLIASRLTGALETDEMFRYYAPSRGKDTAPNELVPYTHLNAEGYYSLPPADVLKQFRVIVTTCVSASFAHNIGIPRGHFTYIFVDEAGHATEPETMIAVKTMADLKTNIVLSGDPKQLGPVIRSAVARRLQLDISYLERLMNTPVYDENKCHGLTVVKLTKNYRSHSAILRYPNERFYGNELEPCGDKSIIESFLGSPILVSKMFPIVFHAMSGKDDREASSPSFFNIEEVLQIKQYVEILRSTTDDRFRVADTDIGIVTPYRAQCLKIRNALRGIADGIKVGSVEEFQGQERRVIIVSTVRSSNNFVEYDLKHTLGFVANPRRFNVAVTRAQALLIVVGDPSVLSLDPLWRSFLNYIHLNNGWTGVPISWDPSALVNDAGGYDAEYRARGLADMNDFARRMEALTLSGVTDRDEGIEEADANVDRPWREVE